MSENYWRSLGRWDSLKFGWKRRRKCTQNIQDNDLIPGFLKKREPVAKTTSVGRKGWGKEMRDLWILLFLPLFLAAFHGVKGCLECDPKFTEDVRILLENLVPLEVPERNQLLERQHKEITHISSKVSHKDKMLRLLGEGNDSWEMGRLKGDGRHGTKQVGPIHILQRYDYCLPYTYFSLSCVAVRNVVKLRVWLKDEFYRLGNETWKGKALPHC